MFLSHRAFQQQLIGIFLMVCAGVLHAATEAGKILYSRGVVSVVDGQESARGGKTGAVVCEGDKVITGRGALAQIRLSDGALIALRGDSQYLIEKQSFGEDEGLYEQAGKLFTGWMRSVTGTIGHKYPQKVSQSTSVATIGIRGTVYQIIHIPPEGLPGFAGEEPGTYVMLEEGEVELTSEDGSKRLLKPGDIVFVPTAGGAPQLAPKKAFLFEHAEESVIDFVESGSPDFSREINTSLTDVLVGKNAFNNPAVVGSAEMAGSFNTSQGFAYGFVISGSGANRALTSMTVSGDGDFLYTPNVGATPSQPGYATLVNGAEINWGTWQAADYTYENALSPGAQIPTTEWSYMIASDYIDFASVTSVTGTATYNYLGGRPLIDNTGATLANILNTSSISFDFGNTGAEISSVNIVTDV